MNPYGNFVYRHLLENGTQEELSRIAELLKDSVLELCNDKIGSYFVQKCLSEFGEEQRIGLVNELLGSKKDVINGGKHTYTHTYRIDTYINIQKHSHIWMHTHSHT